LPLEVRGSRGRRRWAVSFSKNRCRSLKEAAKGGFRTAGAIDKNKIFEKWFGDSTPNPSQKRTFSSAIRAAASVFKVSALEFYKTRNLNLKNPFVGIELILLS